MIPVKLIDFSDQHTHKIKAVKTIRAATGLDLTTSLRGVVDLVFRGEEVTVNVHTHDDLDMLRAEGWTAELVNYANVTFEIPADVVGVIITMAKALGATVVTNS